MGECEPALECPMPPFLSSKSLLVGIRRSAMPLNHDPPFMDVDIEASRRNAGSRQDHDVVVRRFPDIHHCR